MKRRLLSMVLGAVMSVSLFTVTTNAVSLSNSKSNIEKTSSMPSSNTSNASEVKGDRKIVNGRVTYSVDMTKYEKGKKVRLWLPISQTNEDQTVEDVKYETNGAKSELTKDAQGNQILYVEWDENAEPASRKVTCSFHATRPEALRPELKESGEMPKELEEYLKPSKMVVTDGETKKLADEITKGKTTTLDKTRAIYDWVIKNMNRDESVKGCGIGDVERLLVTKEGKCTDINSVFIGLCRASGIPAREMFGVRMNADDITKNQHCWAQFYLPGTGWVYADPADVLKAVLKNKWDKEAKETKDLQEYFFGSMDEKRVELSRGRDIVLTPKQDGEPLNEFGYPYAEVDGKAIDSKVPTDFMYTITFKAD